MRAAPANFTAEQLAAAVQLAHAKGVKVYLTCNTLPHNADLPQFLPYLREMAETGIDAVIVAHLCGHVNLQIWQCFPNQCQQTQVGREWGIKKA